MVNINIEPILLKTLLILMLYTDIVKWLPYTAIRS